MEAEKAFVRVAWQFMSVCSVTIANEMFHSLLFPVQFSLEYQLAANFSSMWVSSARLQSERVVETGPLTVLNFH